MIEKSKKGKQGPRKNHRQLFGNEDGKLPFESPKTQLLEERFSTPRSTPNSDK